MSRLAMRPVGRQVPFLALGSRYITDITVAQSAVSFRILRKGKALAVLAAVREIQKWVASSVGFANYFNGIIILVAAGIIAVTFGDGLG